MNFWLFKELLRLPLEIKVQSRKFFKEAFLKTQELSVDQHRNQAEEAENQHC